MNRCTLILLACSFPAILFAQNSSSPETSRTFSDSNESQKSSNSLRVDGLDSNVTVGPDIGITIPGNAELMKKHYLEKLYVDMTGAPNSVAERFNFDVNKLGDIYIYLLQVRQEEKALGREAINEMCRVWRSNEGALTESQRAMLALDAHKRIETTPSRNKFVASAIDELGAMLGPESMNILIEDMELYAQRSRAKIIYFADLVRHVGREVDQMNLSCGV